MNSPLALLGGPPAVHAPGPHFTWPPVSETTESAVAAQLRTAVSVYDRSGVIAELEDALAGYFGARHALLTSSGTAALFDLYAACGIRPGDEVICPAYTFFATVTPLLHLGAIPVLADCDHNGNLDPSDAASKVTRRTTAIMVTHMWGVPANTTALRKLADSRGLLLLEDGSHAHGASNGQQKAGTAGHGSAFSMNGPKPLSAGEGGFLLTSDDDTYYRALLHGQYNKRCRSEIPPGHPMRPYAVTGTGLKHRIHPLAAAIALDQLGQLDGYLDGRAKVAACLADQLGDIPGIRVPRHPTALRPSWYGLILRYQPEELGGLPLSRFYQALLAEGCAEADRPGSACPLNLLPLFQDPAPILPACEGKLAYQPGDFPRAEAFHAGAIKLPVWHRDEDIPLAGQYAEAFRKVSEHHRDLLA